MRYVILALAVAACATSAKVFGEDQLAIRVPPGETFTIQLESNPSTGYGWELSEPPRAGLLRLADRYYQAPPTERVGAAGADFFEFEAVSEGETTLSFTYRRAWEEPQPTDRVVTFTVTAG